jgi:hypothetical protein
MAVAIEGTQMKMLAPALVAGTMRSRHRTNGHVADPVGALDQSIRARQVKQSNP